MIAIPPIFEAQENKAAADLYLTNQLDTQAQGGVGSLEFLGLCGSDLCKMAAWAENHLGIVVEVTGRFNRVGAYLCVEAYRITDGVINRDAVVASKTLLAKDQTGGTLISTAMSIMTELSRQLMLEVQKNGK